MASQGVAASSRLAEMQMKFQKKQLLEREQKKLALAGGGDGSASDTSVTSKSSIGNGKVRQMFDDRRRGVGIDRSHPLKPITTTTTTTVTTKTSTHSPSTVRPAGGVNVPRRTIVTNSTMKKSSTTNTIRSINNNHPASNGNGKVFDGALDDMDNLENETFPKEFSSLSLDNTRVMGSHIIGDRFYNNNNHIEGDALDATITISKSRTSPKTNGIKLNPVITKKSPNTTTATRTTPQYRAPSSGNRISTVSKTITNTTNATKSPLQKTLASTTRNVKTTASKAGATKPATFVMAVKPPPRISTPPPGMAACPYCQRNFNEERLEKHEEVCQKMTTKKRKIFDASKHRVQGTEAEKYVKKKIGRGTNSSSAPKHTNASATNSSQTQSNAGAAKKGNWRQKHEEFIAAIREAKKVQAYLAKGGKLSDLPPPPPSENPDYIQCPHCSRRFNESAAERHIPKCANMQHNKPKTPAAKKRF